ncbi:hypothetical protein ABFA25_10285 [Mycobacterium lepromatosis]
MVTIGERAAEAARPCGALKHWAGDLIIGKNQAPHINALAEHSIGFVQLRHLSKGRSTDVVAAAMITTLNALPQNLGKTPGLGSGPQDGCS